MNMQLRPRHFCFPWLLRRMRRKCIFNTSSTCNLICYCREESIDNLDISQLPVFGAQVYLEWSVLVHPQHRMGSDHCRAGQGKLVCVPRKTGSASGYVLGGIHISLCQKSISISNSGKVQEWTVFAQTVKEVNEGESQYYRRFVAPTDNSSL